MTFHEFLVSRAGDDPVGDIGRDLEDDANAPRTDRELYVYLGKMLPESAQEVLADAWLKFLEAR